MAGAFGDADAGGTQTGEGFEHSGDKNGIGIDGCLRAEFDQIRFEQDSLAGYGHAMIDENAADDIGEIFCIGSRTDDGHPLLG